MTLSLIFLITINNYISQKKLNSYERIFGAGPRGILISVVLFYMAYYLEAIIGLPLIFNSDELRYCVFAVFVLLGSAFVVWSLYSLPPKERGKRLVTSGAYQYVRHPLYASFLLFFNTSLAFLLDNWIYLIWAIVLFPVWSVNVKREEQLMANTFGKAYEVYCEKTWRFFPKF